MEPEFRNKKKRSQDWRVDHGNFQRRKVSGAEKKRRRKARIAEEAHSKTSDIHKIHRSLESGRDRSRLSGSSSKIFDKNRSRSRDRRTLSRRLDNSDRPRSPRNRFSRDLRDSLDSKRKDKNHTYIRSRNAKRSPLRYRSSFQGSVDRHYEFTMSPRSNSREKSTSYQRYSNWEQSPKVRYNDSFELIDPPENVYESGYRLSDRNETRSFGLRFEKPNFRELDSRGRSPNRFNNREEIRLPKYSPVSSSLEAYNSVDKLRSKDMPSNLYDHHDVPYHNFSNTLDSEHHSREMDRYRVSELESSFNLDDSILNKNRNINIYHDKGRVSNTFEPPSDLEDIDIRQYNKNQDFHDEKIEEPHYSGILNSTDNTLDYSKEFTATLTDQNRLGTRLTSEQAKHLEHVLTKELDKLLLIPNRQPPVFKKWKYINGVLRIICSNESSLEWLKITVEKLPPLWEGANLKITSHANSKLTKAIIFIPGPKDDIEIVKRRLIVQNPWVNVQNWTIYQNKEQPHGQLIALGMPSEDAELISSRGNKLFYKFSSLVLKIYTKKNN